MVRTPMPEATIDEYCDATLRECHVGPAANACRCKAFAEAKAATVKL
jgi:hypothetical protein